MRTAQLVWRPLIYIDGIARLKIFAGFDRFFWEDVMIRALLVILMLLGWCGLARATSCDPSAEGGGACTPQGVRASFYFEAGRSGLLVTWAIYDTPLPDTVRVYRTPKDNAQGYVEISGSAYQAFDTDVSPNLLYTYTVCAEYDQEYCSPPVTQGVPGGNPAPSPGPASTLPSNLTIREYAAWVTPSRWERRWVWDWGAGNGQTYDVVTRELRHPTDPAFDPIGSNLTKLATHYEEVMPVTTSQSLTFRVCATRLGQGLNRVGCTNAVTVTPAPIPSPKAPVKLGASQVSTHEGYVRFSSGDENISAWFEVERLDGHIGVIGLPQTHGDLWTLLSPRVNMGSPGRLRDDGSGSKPEFDNPFIYRVCAGNTSGRTCSDSFKAKAATEQSLDTPFSLVGLAGKCMDVFGGRSDNGTHIILFQCTGGANQLWSRSRSQAHIDSSIHGLANKCLDVGAGGQPNNTSVDLWDCNGGPNQSWTFASDGTIENANGLCLDVFRGDPTDGQAIVLWNCTGGPNQKWTPRP
jgi:hypothetical protein